jgi:tetratricopeptide (TPR) repeat protein
MSFLKRLFGLDVNEHMERANKYVQIGKLGMARLELEQCLELATVHDPKIREKVNLQLDQLTAREQVDAKARAQEALELGDTRKSRYFLNVALAKVEEGSPAYDQLMFQLNSLPEDPDERRLEEELGDILSAEAGVNFVGRQRALEFWKSGFPPYKEEYYLNKALNSNFVLMQAEQVAKNPDEADAVFNFGTTLAQLGLVDKALQQLKHFVELRPHDRDGHYFLANLLADQGFDDDAIREFEKTIQIDPKFQEAYFYLAEHFLNLGDTQRAEKLFMHLSTAEIDGELAEDARAKLAEIRGKVRTA